MARLKSRRYLMATILGVGVFLVAFGIALAAVFQATREVPSDLIFRSVLVQNERLGVFPTAEATGAQVNVLHFRGAAWQPPLFPGVRGETVFLKNLSTSTPFRVFEPCRDLLAAVGGTGSAVKIGFMNARITDLGGEFLGHACDRTVTVAPQQVVTARVNINLQPGVATDVVHTFTTVFGAVGEILFGATLSGSQEVPSVDTSGSGSGTFVLSPGQTQLSYNVTFSGLGSATTGAHIHNAAAGANGGIICNLSPSGPPTSPLNGTCPMTPFLVTELNASRLYVNIHTQNFLGGEIRGQIVMVP